MSSEPLTLSEILTIPTCSWTGSADRASISDGDGGTGARRNPDKPISARSPRLQQAHRTALSGPPEGCRAIRVAEFHPARLGGRQRLLRAAGADVRQQDTRKISRHIREDARDVARQIAKTNAYTDASRRRKNVEMLFADLKKILRLDRLRLREPKRERRVPLRSNRPEPP